MENNETFNFYYTDTDKVERIVYGIPFAEKGIQWYFLSSVESTVFTDQNRTFLVLSMAMLGGIVIVIIVALLLMMSFQNKAITAKAEAKARSAFLANMSHEIRTPLNGILGLIYLIEKDIDNKEDDNIIKKRLDKTKETADYLLSLINNILDISKLEAGKVELQKESISLELIMDSIRSMQKNNIESRGIQFIVEKEMLAPWIIGDDVQIKRVLMNIVGNASKFTSPGGEIRFSVMQEKEDERHVTTIFTCADTGCGMSEGFLEHIWDSFSQERRNNDESIKGTGLGMAISKTLMDAMGGSITVESKLGEGSTFTVILHSEIGEAVIPYKKENEEHLEKLPEKNKQAKILVAEDNELNAEILIEILEGEGFEVDHAQNGQIAIEKFRDSAVGEYKVILMDMQMPVMDGCEATQGIRAMNREDADKITIFACTANNFHEDREKAIMSGMNDFLAKPVDVHILLQKLEGIRFVY
jgi:signal transduction histidine kinase/ActR/RegA family two-component response regulator